MFYIRGYCGVSINSTILDVLLVYMSQEKYLGSDFLPCSFEDEKKPHEQSKPPKMSFEVDYAL